MTFCPVLLRGLNDFHSHQQGGGFFPSIPSPALTVKSFYADCSGVCEVMSLLIHSSLILADAEHLFTCSVAISMSSLEKGPLKSCAPI